MFRNIYSYDKISEIRLRIDLRTFDKKILQVLKFAKIIDSKILYDNKIYFPESNIIISLKKFSATKFCEFE